jgi:GNAT superfamily N-acetyltransferase
MLRNFAKFKFLPVQIFRTATRDDILQLHTIRMAVKENALSDPGRIIPTVYQEMLELNGKGWVCEVNNKIAGFAIVDMKNKNIWALFVHPDFEGKGIGKAIFRLMVNWSFDQGIDKLWLGTAPGTRAEHLYATVGWEKKGIDENGEIRFECTKEIWQALAG